MRIELSSGWCQHIVLPKEMKGGQHRNVTRSARAIDMAGLRSVQDQIDEAVVPFLMSNGIIYGSYVVVVVVALL